MIRGKQLKALIDTGSSQTLVGARWVPRDAIQADLPVQIRCVHGDVVAYPTADIYMQIGEQEYLGVAVGVAEHLPYPVVLGRDIPGLVHLVEPAESCNVVVTRSRRKEAESDVSWDMLPYAEGPPKTWKSRSQRRQDRFRGTRLPETLPLPESGEQDPLAISPNIKELQRSDDTLKA